MTSLFEPPINVLERLILNNTMWEVKVQYSNAHLKKHTAAEATIHQFTDITAPEIWCPLFNNNVVDEE